MLPRVIYRYYAVRPPCQRVSTQEGQKENTRVTGNEHCIIGKDIICLRIMPVKIVIINSQGYLNFYPVQEGVIY